VRALIELGADVNKARYSGATPLKWATRR
jgi:hypothetical protein